MLVMSRYQEGADLFSHIPTGASRWCVTLDSALLSEATVQLVILTSIADRKPLTRKVEEVIGQMAQSDEIPESTTATSSFLIVLSDGFPQ